MNRTTVKFHVDYWDGGWCQAVNPRRTQADASAAARRFAKRYPHLKPISVIREVTSVLTVEKHR